MGRGAAQVEPFDGRARFETSIPHLVVQVGKDGLSEGLVGALDAALLQHELIKVRLGEAAGSDRRVLGAALAEAAAAELVQVLGRTVLIYRRRAEDPVIELPH